MKYVKGNLIELAKEGKFDIIMHGCNCFNTMGKGIAPQIKEAFPEAYEADCKTTKGDRNKLGSFSYAHSEVYKLIIVNAYTQYRYAGIETRGFIDDKTSRFFNYDAFEKILIKVRSLNPTAVLGMPKIGCGLARGKWDVVEYIIEKNFPNDDNIIIVEYDK